MNAIELTGALLVGAGAVFFVVGTIGFLRFPDTMARLHALTKVDNLGLGLTALGAWMFSLELAAGIKLLLVWGLTLFSSASAGHLIAQAAHRRKGVGRVEDAG